jgi:hypothetical protein
MKGQRYVPLDFGGPAATTADTIPAGETRVIRAEPVIERAPEVTAEPAPTYVARRPAKRNHALWAVPLALALGAGALWAASTNDDDAEPTETAAAETAPIQTATTTTTTVAEPTETAASQAAAPAPLAAAPVARPITTASAATPAPVVRVQRTETRTAVARATPRAAPARAVEARSASDVGVNVSGAGAVDLSSPAAGSGELPAGPQPYARSTSAGSVQEPAPVGVETAPVTDSPPVLAEDTAPVAP